MAVGDWNHRRRPYGDGFLLGRWETEPDPTKAWIDEASKITTETWEALAAARKPARIVERQQPSAAFFCIHELLRADAHLRLRLFLDLRVFVSRGGLLQCAPLVEFGHLTQEEIEDMPIASEQALVRALLAHAREFVHFNPLNGLWSFPTEI